LAIKDFPGFVREVKKHNIKVGELLKPYLSSRDFQMIAFSGHDGYEKTLKSDPELISKLKIIHIESEKLSIIVRALEGECFNFERQTKIHFSYQALVAIAGSAIEKYPGHDSYAQALEIFNKLGPKLVKNKIKKVTVKNMKELLVA
jgi:hypothetical protein